MDSIQFTIRTRPPLEPDERIGLSYSEFLYYLARYNLLDIAMLEDPVSWLKKREKGKKGAYDGSVRLDGLTVWWVWSDMDELADSFTRLTVHPT